MQKIKASKHFLCEKIPCKFCGCKQTVFIKIDLTDRFVCYECINAYIAGIKDAIKHCTANIENIDKEIFDKI